MNASTDSNWFLASRIMRQSTRPDGVCGKQLEIDAGQAATGVTWRRVNQPNTGSSGQRLPMTGLG